jgi:hypothetical protein
MDNGLITIDVVATKERSEPWTCCHRSLAQFAPPISPVDLAALTAELLDTSASLETQTLSQSLLPIQPDGNGNGTPYVMAFFG